MIKTLNELEIEATDEKPTANITLNSERLKAFLQDQEQGKDARFHHFYTTPRK